MNAIERAMIAVMLLILAYLIFSVGVMVGRTQRPTCYEDSALFWGGDAHNVCIPLDDYEGGDR